MAKDLKDMKTPTAGSVVAPALAPLLPPGRSAHSPRVRDGLCRHIRSKGMIVNIDEKPENASSQRNYLSVDPHALAWDGSTWWCTQTSKTIGPDDRPCDESRCTEGRRCYTAEDALV